MLLLAWLTAGDWRTERPELDICFTSFIFCMHCAISVYRSPVLVKPSLTVSPWIPPVTSALKMRSSATSYLRSAYLSWILVTSCSNSSYSSLSSSAVCPLIYLLRASLFDRWLINLFWRVFCISVNYWMVEECLSIFCKISLNSERPVASLIAFKACLISASSAFEDLGSS